MPSKRTIDAALHYLSGAASFKETWEAILRRSERGDQLTQRDLVEMHGAALGMIWATHTRDLDSALAILDRLEADSATVHQDAVDRRDLARRILEVGISPTRLSGLKASETLSPDRRPRPLVSGGNRSSSGVF